MLHFISFTVAYWLFCALFFCIVQKPLFGIANRKTGGELISLRRVWRVYRYGFVSDAIVASYMTAVPLLAGLAHVFVPSANMGVVLGVYNVVVAVAVGLLVVSDAVLYGFWKSKIDESVFTYLRSFKGAFASVSGMYVATGVMCAVFIGALFFAGAQWICMRYCAVNPSSGFQWWGYLLATVCALLMIGILFVVIRGLKIRPNNTSVVYHSHIPFFNHWALNPAYSIIYTLSAKDKFRGQFHCFDDDECRKIVEPLFPVEGTPQTELLTTKRPNVLVVIWESFGARFVGSLGGNPDVSPCFDRIASEGVLFTNCTAGSFRTDRGLVCILSGFLGQPTTSVIKYTRKLPNLPGLPREFKALGYETTAVHGGDLSIMRKADYYFASGHDRLVSQKDFPAGAANGKWGVHDGEVFDWLYDDIIDKTSRGVKWFTTFQTLSSHEPFIVPYRRLEDDVDNSFAYTDDSFGRFVDRLRQTPAWNDLLIVCVADHGANIGDGPEVRSDYAHIPVLLTGGAVAAPRRIDTLMSQTDIAATILGQMGLPHKDFSFSRDVLADTYKEHFSFHTYNNGFMLTDERGVTDYDNVASAAVTGGDDRRERMGKAILQALYADLADR